MGVFQRPSVGSQQNLPLEANSAMFSSTHYRSSTFSSIAHHSSTEYSSPNNHRRRRRCDNCLDSPSTKATVRFLKGCIESVVWKGFMVSFSMLVLFGYQIRLLWIPPSGDEAFDYVMTITFAFFILDILVRICVEPNYFNFQISNAYRGTGFGETKTCSLGSFLFWCDLISTATILYEISFINKELYTESEMTIVLNENGYPTLKAPSLSILNFEGVESTLLLTIAQTARVARFVRSPTLVHASNKVNWYWFTEQFKFFNPFFYRRKFRQRQQQERKSTLHMNENEPSTFGKNRALQTGMPNDGRSMLQSQTNSPEQRWNTIRKLVHSMKGMDSERLASRNEAAIKIQRAWRAEGPSDLLSTRKTASPRRSQRASRFQLKSGLNESQVGSEMRELTGQRVAFGILLSLAFSVIFTYTEPTTTSQTTMIVLHNQTQNQMFLDQALETARETSIPTLFKYQSSDGIIKTFNDANESELKDFEKLIITVRDSEKESIGWFSCRKDMEQMAWMSILATFFIITIWFFGVTAFSGPVMVLVVTPLERMVRLLGMLMLDPLGYQSTSRFQKFLLEEDNIHKNTKWTKEVLNGMETSLLMSTILRIGSLMKVGFGSAGVEIIKNNLQKGQNKNVLILSSQGSTISCIFLFCDIRQFTVATECLQEEVFVFTNRIAAVIHSICHSYGGTANKNVGDAFLLSWSLEDQKKDSSFIGERTLRAKNHEGDKALLSVIKICLALFYDQFYLEPLSDVAKMKLQDKLLKKRLGPVVQMGFGLHAGKAVQGAIGSQRKIDATYVSEAVKRAEFLESETKTYGLRLLMSGDFHTLLDESTQRRCRKIDQVFIKDDDEDDDEDEEEHAAVDELLHIYTYDMDVATVYRAQELQRKLAGTDTVSDAGSTDQDRSLRRLDRNRPSNRQLRNRGKRNTSLRNVSFGTNDDVEGYPKSPSSVDSMASYDETNNAVGPPELVLPSGPSLYNRQVWLSKDMKRMREKYVRGLFFQKYQAGLQAFYSKDWITAQQCFSFVLDELDDGPSRYFMDQIKKYNGKPPRDFLPYRRT